MQILEFFFGGFLVLFINGFAIIIVGGIAPLSYREMLPCPVVGACALSVMVTALYRWGVPPCATALCSTAISVLVVAAFIVRNQGAFELTRTPPRAIVVRCFCFAAIAVVILLPHYLGGEQFVVFQGNRHDMTNYLSGAFGYANYPYSYLSSFDVATEPAAGLAEAAKMLGERPTVALLYASLYKIFSHDFLSNAYEFCLIGQMNFYFAFLYLSLNLFPKNEWRAQVASVAFGVGFFAQYILDINAWSELFAVPMMIVLVTDYCRGLLLPSELIHRASHEPSRWPNENAPLPADSRAMLLFIMVRLPIIAAGMVYVYPEIAPVAGLGCASALMFRLFGDINRGHYAQAMRMLGANAKFALVALALISAYWKGTIGFLFGQLSIASQADVKWHYFFQAYLFGGAAEMTEYFKSSAGADYWFHLLLAAPANFLAGLFGLYFLRLRQVWEPAADPLYLIWAIVLLVWLGMVVLEIARSAGSECRSRNGGNSHLCFVAAAALATSAVPIGLLLKGQYWAAGKGLSMISPFIFAALIVPVMTGQRSRIAALSVSLVIAGHLGFGVFRPVAVAGRVDGSHYDYPYPALAAVYKTGGDWDLVRYDQEINRCTLAKIDVGEPFLRRLVENYVMEKKIAWFSLDPEKSYYGSGADLPRRDAPVGRKPDCTITTTAGSNAEAANAIVLDRARR